MPLMRMRIMSQRSPSRLLVAIRLLTQLAGVHLQVSTSVFGDGTNAWRPDILGVLANVFAPTVFASGRALESVYSLAMRC